MPIRSINEDGTINIYNKNTKEERTVRPEELGQISPKLVAAYASIVADQQAIKEATNPTPEENSLKQSDESMELLNRIRKVQKARGVQGYGTEEAISTGPMSKMVANLKTTLGADTDQAVLQDALKELLLATRKEVTGVAFAPQEQAELEALLGTLSTQEGPLARKLADKDIEAYQKLLDRGWTEEELAASGIQKPAEFVRDEKTMGDRAKDVYDFMLGTSTRVAQDVGTGQAMKNAGVNEANQAALDKAQELYQKAQETDDPEVKARMLAVAQDTFNTVSGTSGEMADMFSEDIQDPIALRALGTGMEVAGTAATVAGLPGAVKSAQNATSKGINAIKSPDTAKAAVDKATSFFKKKPAAAADDILEMGTQKIANGKEIRNAALKEASKVGKKIDGNKFARDIAKWGQEEIQSNARNKKAVTEFVKNVTSRWKGKQIKPETAKRLWDKARKGFDASGKAGNTLEASYHRAVRDSLRTNLDDITGGAFEKGTQLIDEGMQLEKVLGSTRDAELRAFVKEMLKEQPSDFERLMGSTPGKIAKYGGALFGANKVLGGTKILEDVGGID